MNKNGGICRLHCKGCRQLSSSTAHGHQRNLCVLRNHLTNNLYDNLLRRPHNLAAMLS